MITLVVMPHGKVTVEELRFVDHSRQNVRVRCSVPVRAHGKGGVVRGICRNLSSGGLFFSGPLLPVGEEVTVHVELPVGPVNALGEVRYHYAYADGTGWGVAFRPTSVEDRQRILWFIGLAKGLITPPH